MQSVAFWDWCACDESGKPEPLPDARVVVCAPEILRDCDTHVATVLFDAGEDNRVIVVSAREPSRAFGSGHAVMPWCVPALYVERQADLEERGCSECKGNGFRIGDLASSACYLCDSSGRIGGISSLLAVKSERRALVVTPREAIDILPWLEKICPGCGFTSHHVGPCGLCNLPRAPGIHLVIVAPPLGPDAWPMHPDWIRTIRDQCAAAGVHFVFGGWGPWVTFDQLSDEVQETVVLGGETIGSGALDEPFWYRIGPERSGRMLDGAVHDALPTLAEEGR